MNDNPEFSSSELVESSLLDQLIACSPIGIAVIDEEGIWRKLNPAYCRLYGYTHEEMVGIPFTRVFPEGQRARLLELHQRFLREGGRLNGEWEVVRRDGTVINVLSESVRVPDEQGNGQRLVYVVDITERQQAEKARQESARLVQSVLDGLTSPICVLDARGVVVMVNRTWSLRRENDTGMSYLGLQGDWLMADPQFSSELQALAEGKKAQVEREYLSTDGWFLARAARLEGTPVRVVVAHDNVNELKVAQERLAASEVVLRDLAASVPGAVFRFHYRSDGTITFVYLSPGLKGLFGLTPEEVQKSPSAIRERILPEDREVYDASVVKAVQEQVPWKQEFRILLPNGEGRWIQADAQLKPGKNGEMIWTGTLSDISERKRIEAGVKASEETYRMLFETVPLGVVYHRPDGSIASANPAARRILGMNLVDVRPESVWVVIREDGSPFPREERPVFEALRSGKSVEGVVMGVSRPDGTITWIKVTTNPIHKNGKLVEVYSCFEDITERVLLDQQLRLQAATDYLTGAANRRSLMQRLSLEWERVQRHPDISVCVLAADLDYFKSINDHFGHAAGDAVLKNVTLLMRQNVRAMDLVARSGGEEFTLLLPDTSLADATLLAERLRARVEAAPTLIGSQSILVTISIGISQIQPCELSADAVMARADEALYLAKRGGRNQVQVWKDIRQEVRFSLG